MSNVMDWSLTADIEGFAANRPGFASPAAPWPRKASAPLAALTGNPLAGRFHNWRGASGRRYICTVFADFSEIGDFSGVLILSVRRDAGGGRRLLDITSRDAPLAKGACGARAAAGANEWHVHLMATGRMARDEAMADLRDVAGRC